MLLNLVSSVYKFDRLLAGRLKIDFQNFPYGAVAAGFLRDVVDYLEIVLGCVAYANRQADLQGQRDIEQFVADKGNFGVVETELPDKWLDERDFVRLALKNVLYAKVSHT